MNQSNLLENIRKFNSKSKLKTKEGKDEKGNTFDGANTLYEGEELTLNAFRSKMFPIKTTKGEGCPGILASRPPDLATRLKILSTKQMLQRLSIALAQVKAANTSENLLNEIRQIIYSVH